MNYFTYFLIFFSKVLENGIGTLRLIVVSNGKKWLGAILQLVISLIWIFSTSIVLIDINKDYFKVVVFVLGCAFGSLIGSIIEEKLAMGSNLVFVITNSEPKCMIKSLRKCGFAVTTFKGSGKYEKKEILIIMVKRKLRSKVFRIVKKCDENAMIIVESARAMGGYH